MAGYASLAGSGGGYAGISSGSSGKPHNHGVFGIVKNLGSDVKNAAEGFLPGMVHLAEHPIGSTEQMAKATWSTWSPLFHGHFTKFGQGVYDHPLAPILDVASIFSLGLGTAAKVGTVADALGADTAALEAAGTTRAAEVGRSLLKQRYYPTGGALERDANILKSSYQPEQFSKGAGLPKADNLFHAAARLKLPRGRVIEGQLKDGSLSVVPTHYSEAPARRLLQEQLTPRVIAKLPPHAKSVLGQMVFRHHMYGWMARRAVITQAARMAHIDASAKLEAEAAKYGGKMPTLDSVLMAGRELTDGEKAANWRTHLAVNLHINLARHAPFRAPDAEAAVKFLMDHPHWRPVSAIPNGAEQDKLIQSLRKREGRFNSLRMKHAELANSVDNIRGQLDLHNQQLQDMYDKGYLHTQTPALNSKGEPALNPTEKQTMNQHAQAIDEQTRIIKRLNAQLEKAYKSKRIHDNAVEQLNTLTPARIALEQRSFTDFYRAAGSSHEAFMKFANNFGRYGVRSFKPGDEASIRRAVDRAFVGKDGSVPLVPKHDPQMLGQELASSAGFVRHMYRKSTRLWKAIQVKWTPKTFTNNTVANHTIALFRHSDPVTMVRSLYHALRMSHGKEADQVLMRATPWRNKSWLMQNFQPELHNNFLQGVEEDLHVRNPKQAATRLGRILKGPGAYALVTKAADEPVRLAAIVAHVFNSPDVLHEADRLQKVARESGRRISRNEALDKAAARVLRRDPALRENAANFGRTIAGDYLAQTPVERGIKDTVPFYLWDRHILKSGANITMDNPIRMALLQGISTGGLAAAQQFLAQMPAFLAGAVPLNMLGLSGTSSNGRINALVAPSLNPFGTLGDMAGAVQSATVGGDPTGAEDLLGQINPLLTDSISAATGKNILTGTSEKMAGGVIPTVLAGLLQGFPESKVVESAVNGPQSNTVTPSGKVFPKLYSQNELAAITNLLGIPIKQISPATAQYEAKQQSPTRKKKIGGYSALG